ncbi:MAG: hypothetical protein P4M09_07720 [Devosia sp.]|nr:hypothetical protein [Devosia sp.]
MNRPLRNYPDSYVITREQMETIELVLDAIDVTRRQVFEALRLLNSGRVEMAADVLRDLKEKLR